MLPDCLTRAAQKRKVSTLLVKRNDIFISGGIIIRKAETAGRAFASIKLHHSKKKAALKGQAANMIIKTLSKWHNMNKIASATLKNPTIKTTNYSMRITTRTNAIA